ncbi:MAG TPA: hypothetical protein VGR71_04430 [Nitrospira sp.]|nr:hypothetical protein [Nitrospira sp.]
MKLPVEEIPLPWTDGHGLTVVALEYPDSRPHVVDLVFSDGTRMAESRGAVYDDTRGYWTSIRFPIIDDGTIDWNGIEAAARIYDVLEGTE